MIIAKIISNKMIFYYLKIIINVNLQIKYNTDIRYIICILIYTIHNKIHISKPEHKNILCRKSIICTYYLIIVSSFKSKYIKYSNKKNKSVKNKDQYCVFKSNWKIYSFYTKIMKKIKRDE